LGAFLSEFFTESNSIIADLNERGAKIVISQHPRRASPLPIDAEIYNWRHLIENFFCKLKEFKRIAMRADKTDQSFAANIHLAAAVKIPDESQQTLVGRLANLSRHTLVRRRQGPRNIYARHTAPVAPAKAIPSRA
jgi:hypothetical protein